MKNLTAISCHFQYHVGKIVLKGKSFEQIDEKNHESTNNYKILSSKRVKSVL